MGSEMCIRDSIDTNLHHGHRQQRVSVASEIEVGWICPTMQELRAVAARKPDTCVAGVAICGMWKVEGVFPCVGINIGGTG